jgi:hypothetical protein
VRLWQQLEIESAELPAFFDEISTAGDGVCRRPSSVGSTGDRNGGAALAEHVRLAVRAPSPRAARIRGPIGRERARGARRATRVRRPRRGRDPRTRLAEARRGEGRTHRAPGRWTRTPTEAEVVDASSPTIRPTFEAALEAYRDAMFRARPPHRARPRDVPDDERIEVIETPDHLRNVVPFAAYFSPPVRLRSQRHLHRHARPSTMMRGPARAQLRVDQQHEHPRGLSGPPPPAVGPAEASVAHPAPDRRAGVRRGLGDVLGADDARARLRRRPAFRIAIHTDAIWRACRIILDVRMHRGELSVEEADPTSSSSTRASRSGTREPRSSGTRTARPTRCPTCSAGP